MAGVCYKKNRKTIHTKKGTSTRGRTGVERDYEKDEEEEGGEEGEPLKEGEASKLNFQF